MSLDVSPERAAALIQLLGVEPGGNAPAALKLVPYVKKRRARGRQAWSVGAPEVGTLGRYGDGDFAESLRCNCRGVGTTGCAHIAAVLLAEAWKDQSNWEQLLQRSRAVQPTRPGMTIPSARTSRGRREVAYILRRVHPPDVLISEDALAYVDQLVERRPIYPPEDEHTPPSFGEPRRSVLDLERDCRIREQDRTIQGQLDRFRLAIEAPAGTSPGKAFLRTHPGGSPEAADPIIRHLLDGLIQQLADVEHLYLDSSKLTVVEQPVKIGVLLVPGSRPDRVRIQLEPPILALVAGSSPWVVSGSLRLQPLANSCSRRGQSLLLEVRGEILRSHLPQRLRTLLREVDLVVGGLPGAAPVRVEADALEPTLVLGEATGGLRIDSALAYRIGPQWALPSATDAPDALILGDGDDLLMIPRDREKEADARSLLSRIVQQDLPAILQGDDALEFLLEDLPVLQMRVGVAGEAELTEHKVLGQLRPDVESAGRAAGMSLALRFRVGDHEVKPREAIRAWRDGRRWLRLDEGWARLPEAWMKQHVETLDELEDIRRGRKGAPLPLHTLTLAAPMLAEASGLDVPDRLAEVLGRLENFDRVPDRAVPPELRADLRSYQAAGWRWLVMLRDLGLGACLADQMGLGKTVQVLAVLADTHRHHDAFPSLVVAPTSVLPHWADEVRKFAPELTLRYHHGTERDSEDDFAGTDIVITSYGTLRRDREHMTGLKWSYVILDEAQAIKNPTSRTSQVCRELDAAWRVVVTGTPLENDLLELWSLFEFVMPGFFGTRAGFDRRYAAPVRKGVGSEALGRLRDRTRPFILRRHKDEVAAELPPLQTQVVWCPLPADQRALYERVRESYREPVLSRVDQEGMGPATLHVLEALLRLRQAAVDPALLPYEEARGVEGSAKRRVLRAMLETAAGSGHRSLVFSQWPSLLKRVAADLTDDGLDYLFLDGTTRERGDLVRRWNDPKGPPVFLISLKAGGSGLNLQAADHVFHLDPWWNPQTEAQATARAHRIGQNRPVMVYRLVARETVEERMLEIQERKRALFEGAIEEDRMVVDLLTRDDLAAVFERPQGDPTPMTLDLPDDLLDGV